MDIQALKSFLLGNISKDEIINGEYIYKNGDCMILSQSSVSVDFQSIEVQSETPSFSFLIA